MKNELVEAKKEELKELEEVKFITPILPLERIPVTQEKSEFFPSAKAVENTGCMSGN